MDRHEASKDPKISRESRSQAATRIFEERRVRADHFADADLFGEPAWDILLYLFQGHSHGRGVKIETISIMLGMPATSALRWLEVLERKELVFAYRDETNVRQIFLRLSSKGFLQMAQYLDNVALTQANSKT